MLGEPVLACIGRQVAPRAAYLFRRLQDVRVIAVGKHGALAAHHPIERPCDTNAQPLHSSRESTLVVCLDQEVNVITEHAELAKAEAKPLLARLKTRAKSREASRAA